MEEDTDDTESDGGNNNGNDHDSDEGNNFPDLEKVMDEDIFCKKLAWWIFPFSSSNPPSKISSDYSEHNSSRTQQN